MIEMKSLNGFEVVDAKAREDIETLKSKEVDVDLSDYYTKTETDTLLENVDADIVISDDGEGNVTIDAAPGSGEGGSSNVDLSNYYTKDETYSKTEVDALIPTGGGSSEGGAKIYYLDFTDVSWSSKETTDEMKEFYDAFYNNDSITLYVKATDNIWYPAQARTDGSVGIIISPLTLIPEDISNLAGGSNYSYEMYILNNRDTYKIYSTNTFIFGAKDWHWIEVNSNSFFLSYDTHHIKLIVQYDSDYFTYEISSRDNISLTTVYDTYQVHRDETYENVSFSGGSVSISNGTIIGYYYWG